MTYLVFVALLGAMAVIILWLRDARIYYRTGFQGYRKAAYWGVLYCALAIVGIACAIISKFELLGLALILAALYLQGRIGREKIWGTEGLLERFSGSAPLRGASKK